MQEESFGREDTHRQSVTPSLHSYRGSNVDFDHHKEKSNLDVLQKELTEMKESIAQASVKCHLLHVDLATQFSPFLVETINNTVEECEKCWSALENTGTEQ